MYPCLFCWFNRCSGVLILLVVLVLSINSIEGAISIISDTIIAPGGAYSEREGVYSNDEFYGKDTATIAFDFIWRPLSEERENITESPPLAEIALVHSSLSSSIGYATFWDTTFCCTVDLFSLRRCKQLNRLIISEDTDTDPIKNGNKLYYWQRDVNTTIDFKQSIEPQVSGIWYLVIANCDMEEMRNLVFSGSTLWMSPFGYLPAQAYGNLIVHWVLVFLYLVGLIAWSLLLFKYRQDLHKYQLYGVTIIVVVSLIEQLFWGITYERYNSTGMLVYGLIGVAVVFSAAKLTGIRFLLLLMGSGYAVTVDKLSPITYTMMTIICFCYFITTAVDALVKLKGLYYPVGSETSFVTAAFLVLFNAVIIFWIVCSTVTTMKRAKQENNQKYPMYKNLLIIFGIICGISVSAFIAVTGITFSGSYDSSFRWHWLFSTYWDFIYYSVNVYIGYVWRPTQDNKRFAYFHIGKEDTVTTSQVELDDTVKTEEQF